ncbi:MAG: nucleotidyltransferase family protein [Verrucomicrobiota bacterium]|nr:nucleotidyltransferase family protein [Verrucomicrobiota bacterium]
MTVTLPDETKEFYCRAIETLREAKIPFMVGGAYAFGVYTGIHRHTKDLDFFIRPVDVERTLQCFGRDGYTTEVTFPHWLAKVHRGEDFLDLIFRAGNGLCEVDDSWFDRAREDEVLGCRALLTPAEEMLWMKSFIMERERFDGADVMHIIHRRAEKIDWQHLVRRFDENWRVLLSHLVLFGYVYPAERHRIPSSVMTELLQWAQEEISASAPHERTCRGTLLSREQYLHDIRELGYADARLTSASHMSAEDVANWTAAIEQRD